MCACPCSSPSSWKGREKGSACYINSSSWLSSLDQAVNNPDKSFKYQCYWLLPVTWHLGLVSTPVPWEDTSRNRCPWKWDVQGLSVMLRLCSCRTQQRWENQEAVKMGNFLLYLTTRRSSLKEKFSGAFHTKCSNVYMRCLTWASHGATCHTQHSIQNGQSHFWQQF